MKAGILRAGVASTILVALSLFGSACGSSSPASPTEDVAAKQRQYERDLAAAPPPLSALVKQQNQLLGGEEEAFQSRLDELRGYPVVVNKWASWCGPCRAEFPYLQSQAAEHGDEVAFLGVDSQDNDDAARTFLGEYPLPYPSYSDPDLKIADALDVEVEFPSTVFFNSDGEQVYANRGGYGSEADLAADIERYAR